MKPNHLLESASGPRVESRPFRFSFALMYITITGAIAYLNGLALCRSYLLVPGDAELGLAVLLLLLLGLEWMERRWHHESRPRWQALLLILVRMALVEGLVALDCTRTALFIYPMIPFSIYFIFGGRASMLASFVYVVLVVSRAAGMGGAWYRNPGMTSNLIGFVFVMLFVPLIAYVIRREEENQQRTEQLLADLRVSHFQLQAYAAEVAELAAAEERNRLARDIHDSLGHYLTAVNIQLEKALAYWERNPAEASQAIRDAKLAAADALRDVRRSVGALRTPEQHFSLRDALQELIRGVDGEGITLDFSLSGDESDYSRAVLMILFRAAQEGLTNIQKHAQASRVTLAVVLGEQEARLTLRDDGRGFDTTALERPAPEQSQRFGLRGIRERLEMEAGRLALQSRPQQGTELVITIPRTLMADRGQM